MSIDGNFRPVSPAVIHKLIGDPRLADVVMRFHPPYDKATNTFCWPDRVRSLWDALLASELGSRVVGRNAWEGGRTLTAEETAAAAAALSAVSDDEMRARYDDFVRQPDGTLPDGWEEQREQMLEVFARARACYAGSRDRGDGMLVYLD